MLRIERLTCVYLFLVVDFHFGDFLLFGGEGVGLGRGLTVWLSSGSYGRRTGHLFYIVVAIFLALDPCFFHLECASSKHIVKTRFMTQILDEFEERARCTNF